jgi:hypothetical protein
LKRLGLKGERNATKNLSIAGDMQRVANDGQQEEDENDWHHGEDFATRNGKLEGWRSSMKRAFKNMNVQS